MKHNPRERQDGPEHFYPTPEMIERIIAEKLAKRPSMTEKTENTALTELELRETLVNRCANIAEVWASAENLTDLERTQGAIGNVLILLDGEGQKFPALQLTVAEDGVAERYSTVEGERAVIDAQVTKGTALPVGGLYASYANALRINEEAATSIAQD